VDTAEVRGLVTSRLLPETIESIKAYPVLSIRKLSTYLLLPITRRCIFSEN
jgi:hypothetical protein